jgi:protein-tyrosine phosphatase
LPVNRIITFRGATNFRDLGGYETSAGAVVRSGRVFRSDSLHTLTAADLTRFDGLGIRVIYDLRGLAERKGFPGPRPDVHLELWTAGVSEAAGLRTSEDGERWLSDGYSAMIERAAPALGRLFDHLANDEKLPAVFHCFGGKDRTGFAAAVLLSALGAHADRQGLRRRGRLSPMAMRPLTRVARTAPRRSARLRHAERRTSRHHRRLPLMVARSRTAHRAH